MAEKFKGTTTVGLVFDGGVVLGAERRATLGSMVESKATKKIFKIDENLGMATSGLVGDAQYLVRYLRAEAALYKTSRGRPMSVKALVTLLSNILNQYKFSPYYVGLLVGGVDEEGPHLYSVDAAGGAIPDKYVSTGSGSTFAIAIFESDFKEGLSEEEAVELAKKALTVAMERDVYSGNGIDIAVITKEGFRVLEFEVKR